MKVGFIGAGNMGGAIMKGAFQKGVLKPYETMVYDISPKAISDLTEVYPVGVADSNIQIAKDCECIVLAIKPQYMQSVLDEIQKYIRNKKVISIAAGWSMDMLSDALGKENGPQIMRVMPNTPALVGEGYTAIAEKTTFTKPMQAWAKELLSSLGEVQVISERLFDAVIAVTGSSPAYVFMLIEAMADGGVKLGMPRQMAIHAAAQAVYGSAKMVLETNQHPAVLKDNVCSPAGSTIDAVEALEQGGFRGTVLNAMNKCAQKSRKMTQGMQEKRRG